MRLAHINTLAPLRPTLRRLRRTLRMGNYFAWLTRLALLGFCAQERAASRVPVSGGERRADQPEVARAGMRVRSPSAQDAPSANPDRRSRTRKTGCLEGVAAGVPFGSFSLGKQGKGT